MLKSSFSNKYVEAGCDEAGRGCLAGPVVASAVILPMGFKHELLNDSKQLSKRQRDSLRIEIEARAIAWSVASVSEVEIDDINILNASFLAMHRAVESLSTLPELLLIDGNRFNPYPSIPHECIVKGDAKYYAIAAASVLAKTHRDELMARYAMEHPQYGWGKNAGYPTVAHRDAIRQFGVTQYHRKTFKLLPEQLDLFQEAKPKK